MKDKVLLSISLLASNRLDTIRRCLDSIKPILEQIPSELILVDTSSNPKVHQILEEYTDNIVEFTWCNDFSKARNAGLTRAKGEWFLFLDDDEWFVEIEPLITFFTSGEYRQYGCANYIVRNFFDANYIHYSDSWVSRAIKREEDTRFVSKIHEYLYPVRGKCKAIEAIANHSGYIYTSEEERQKHFKRNTDLLKQMIQEEPDRLRWKVQLVQEYRSVKAWDELCNACEQALEATKHVDEKYDNYDIGTFYGGEIEGLFFLKRYEEGIAIGERALKDERTGILCKAYMYLGLATIYLAIEAYEKAEEAIRRYFDLYATKKNQPDVRNEQQAALITGKAFDDIPQKKAYSILISCGLKKKDISLLKKYFGKLGWDEKVIYLFEGILVTLVEAMAVLPQDEVFVELMQRAWKNQELQHEMLCEIQKWEAKDAAGYQKIVDILIQIEAEHWYVWYIKIISAKRCGLTDNLNSYYEGFFRNSTNVFMTPGILTDIAKENGISLEKYYLAVPFEHWKSDLSDYIAKVDYNGIAQIEIEFRGIMQQENARYDYLFMKVAEAKLLLGVHAGQFQSKRNRLLEFANRTIAFYEKYYTELATKQYPELLPPEYMASQYIYKALETEAEDWQEAFETIREAVDVYPKLAEVIKIYLQEYGIERDRQERKEKEEYRQLTKQIKEKAQEFYEKGLYNEAMQILQQLKQMIPEDLEVADMVLKTRIAIIEG